MRPYQCICIPTRICIYIILTAVPLVATVGTIDFAVAALGRRHARGADAAVHVAGPAVGAVTLVREVRAIDHAVADARRQGVRLQLADAACREREREEERMVENCFGVRERRWEWKF